jgi:hypothetical protein
MRMLRCVVAASAILAFDGSAFAATVTAIAGPLQVNTGSGFHKVAGSAEVAPGSSVMVEPAGKAQITYTDGCKVPVNPGAIAVVAPVSPCAQGADLGLPPPTYNDPGYLNYLGYGLALGAGIGIGCAIWCGQHGSTNIVPVSP